MGIVKETLKHLSLYKTFDPSNSLFVNFDLEINCKQASHYLICFILLENIFAIHMKI